MLRALLVLSALAFCGLLAWTAAADAADETPYPFERELSYGDSGDDVWMLQALLNRPAARLFAAELKLPQSGVFDDDTAAALAKFRGDMGLIGDPIFTSDVAAALVSCCLADGYRDDGIPAVTYGKLYKIKISAYRDRSRESWATLYDANNDALLHFRVHTKGQGARNELTLNGDTPTGLMELDFHGPMNDEQTFGPYPVNRAVCAKQILGLQTNAELVLGLNRPASSLRGSLLLHTANYSRLPGWEDWQPPMTMPDGKGNIHAYWDDVGRVASTLKRLGVVERPNPFGKQPYPYEPQGLLSVELLDAEEATLHV